MRSTPPRPLLTLGALALALAAGRARADQSPAPAARGALSRAGGDAAQRGAAPTARGPRRTAQAQPPTDTPFGRYRTDQAPGNDSAAGRPRPSGADAGGDPARPGAGSAGSLGGQNRVVPLPTDSPPPRPVGPEGAAERTPPTAGAPPDVEAQASSGAPSGPGEPAGAVAAAPAWRPELPSDRFLRRPEPRPPLLEIGPSLVYAVRVTEGEGPSYKSTFAPSFALRARLRSWLVIGARYLSVAHELNLPPNSFGLEGDTYEVPRRTFVRTLDAYLHPTLRPTEWLSVWATVGLGWGQFTLPPVRVTNPPGGSSLRARTGVFADVPLGLGVGYNLPFRWLTVSAEGLFEPVYYQEGMMYEKTRYINFATRDFAEAAPMPQLKHSFAAIFNLSIAL
ncbi:MAG TPA: hypothetical protein VFS43_41680 [Polyangiaceae bacterium]|nr:hypothetical protein [Polyangiaceae bacterium]